MVPSGSPFRGYSTLGWGNHFLSFQGLYNWNVGVNQLNATGYPLSKAMMYCKVLSWFTTCSNYGWICHKPENLEILVKSTICHMVLRMVLPISPAPPSLVVQPIGKTLQHSWDQIYLGRRPGILRIWWIWSDVRWCQIIHGGIRSGFIHLQALQDVFSRLVGWSTNRAGTWLCH